jgi:hypothetical protein
MRKCIALLAVLGLLLAAVPTVQAQAGQQLLQGTQLKLVLLNGLSTSVARDGDPFAAVVAEPVYLGGQLLLPAGARVNGEIRTVTKPKRFGLVRGQANMLLIFKSIEIDRREIPAPMSIITIYEAGQTTGKKRGDVKTEEGALVAAKRDVKGTVTTLALGTGGGSAVGAVFSHAMRGLWIGLAGSAAYVIIKKGKDVELPAQTGFLVRMDSTITLPSAAGSAPYTGGMP